MKRQPFLVEHMRQIIVPYIKVTILNPVAGNDWLGFEAAESLAELQKMLWGRKAKQMGKQINGNGK
jgi:hypothetical protein